MKVTFNLACEEAHSGFDAVGRPLQGGTAMHQAVGVAKGLAWSRDQLCKAEGTKHYYRVEKHRAKGGKPSHWKVYLYPVPKTFHEKLSFQQQLHTFIVKNS